MRSSRSVENFGERGGRRAGFFCANLKQKCVFAVDKMVLTRDVALSHLGIEVEVEITYHEGEPVEQKLAITFSEVDAADFTD